MVPRFDAEQGTSTTSVGGATSGTPAFREDACLLVRKTFAPLGAPIPLLPLLEGQYTAVPPPSRRGRISSPPMTFAFT